MMTRRRIAPSSDEWHPRHSELHPHTPPKELYVEGLPLPDVEKSVAIVGTRKCTAAGKDAATRMARDFAKAGFAVVSGLAVGIDAAAHRGALDAGGHTVAVLGAGLDSTYPSYNRRLRDQIGKRGTVVTEYPEGTEPLKSNFPARNRIIVGLSKGVVVVEGGEKSGALITARIALDVNRSVWAIPGSYRNAMARGPNELIRTSEAGLVTEVEHIFEELAPSLIWKDREGVTLAQAPQLEEGEAVILRFLDDSPLAADRIARELGLDPAVTVYALSRLQVRGFARKWGGGYQISDTGARVRQALV
jgi:DNA processing protein